MDFCSALGVHALPGGAVTTFPCKFGQKSFLRPGGWVHVHPLATPVPRAYQVLFHRYFRMSVSQFDEILSIIGPSIQLGNTVLDGAAALMLGSSWLMSHCRSQ